MKILMVNKFLYKVGGCENYMFGLGDILIQKGHEVQYFGLYSEKNIGTNEMSLYVKNYDEKKLINPFSLLYNREAYKKMLKLLDLYAPDIVHMNNISYHLTSSIIDACKKRNIPVVMTIHDPQLICPNHMLYRYDTKKICNECVKTQDFKKCLKYKCIKGSTLKSYLGYRESVRTHSKKAYDYISKLICPSEFIRNKLIEGGYSEEQIIVLRNYSSKKRSVETIDKKDYILFFGRLSEEKGIDLLLEALPDNIKLVIAGTGPLSDKVSSLTKSNVKYVGFKTGIELEKLISEALFSVYPSKWYENCPLSIFESINLCTPVIAANCGGNIELIDNNINGLLYENCNAEDLKSKINYLYNNPDILKNMQENCLNYNKVPSQDDYYNKLINLYEKVLKDAKNNE